MRTTVSVRPEQARYLIELKRQAEQAYALYVAALTAATKGLVNGKGRIETIADDGTVTVILPNGEDD